MPRNVRPAWLTAHADGRQSEVGLGPRARIGYLGGRLTLRTPEGEVSEPILYTAGGPWPRLLLEVPAGFTISIDGVDIRSAAGHEIRITPTSAAR